ncbi:MAG: arsenite S-adenosylmethyltransferase, partial [Bacteroidetes bacterium]|nr:arsenite S-adenosylmethyltransferase [Bacteroidota bacterium]
CVSGAIRKEEYLEIIENTGFTSLKIQKERVIDIPEDIYLKFISKDDLEKFKESNIKLVSINVYADKPEKPCCDPKGGCC